MSNNNRNKALTDEQVRKLIDDFFEGATSPDDEHAIYDYFESHRNLPPDLENQRSMFQWFGNGCSETKSVATSTKGIGRLKPAEWFCSAAVAASLVLGCTLSWNDHHRLEQTRNVYEGSYAMIDGKRETDIKKILPIIIAKQVSVDARIKSFERLAEIDAYAIGDSIFKSLTGNILNQNINH